jgi:hypothetical protein
MQPITRGNFGPNKTNAVVPKNPSTDFDAAMANGLFDLTSQTTLQNNGRMKVVFSTSTASTGSGPVQITPTWGTAEWGNAPANYPVVQKTATGTYLVTAPATWTNSLDTPSAGELQISQVETVSFNWTLEKAVGNSGAVLASKVVTTFAGNVITVFVYAVTVSGGALVFTLSDLSGGVPIFLSAG